MAGGYARLRGYRDELEIVELAAPPDQPDASAEALRAIAACARDLGLPKITGWIDPPEPIARWWSPVDRSTTLPMVAGPAAIDTAWLPASDYF